MTERMTPQTSGTKSFVFAIVEHLFLHPASLLKVSDVTDAYWRYAVHFQSERDFADVFQGNHESTMSQWGSNHTFNPSTRAEARDLSLA